MLYTPESIRHIDPLADIGLPGEYPFTRGVQPTMYRGRLWTMRQYSGFGTPRESNQRYKWLLEQGQTGISVALDLPTQLGLDSDDPQAIDDVGRVGVAIDTLADMETLFDGIPLDRISTSFTINSTAAILLAMYLRGGRAAGRAAGEDHRHDSERHPQGIRRARHLDFPARAVAAPDRRHHRALHRMRRGLIRSALPARISATPARPRSRNWPIRWPTGSPTSSAASIAA